MIGRFWSRAKLGERNQNRLNSLFHFISFYSQSCPEDSLSHGGSGIGTVQILIENPRTYWLKEIRQEAQSNWSYQRVRAE